MKAFSVIASTAGIESTAKSKSVVSTTSSTTNKGVANSAGWRTKNLQKNKKVIDAERKLDGIAGNELQRRNAAMPEENKRCERSRQNDPHGAPGKSLPESDFVCTTMKDAEV